MALTVLERASETARTFLRAELRIGNSFAELASRKHVDTAQANREQKSSRKAYDTVERLLPQLRFLSPEEVNGIRGELHHLQEKLKKLGEKF